MSKHKLVVITLYEPDTNMNKNVDELRKQFIAYSPQDLISDDILRNRVTFIVDIHIIQISTKFWCPCT